MFNLVDTWYSTTRMWFLFLASITRFIYTRKVIVSDYSSRNIVGMLFNIGNTLVNEGYP